MTNEWIDWTEGRYRTPLRGTSAVATAAAAAAVCHNTPFLNNNNYTAASAVSATSLSSVSAAAASTKLGLMKVHAVMKSLQRPKGISYVIAGMAEGYTAKLRKRLSQN